MYVEIEHAAGKLKVTWGGEAGPYGFSYIIVKKDLVQAADAVRDELKTLSYWAINRDPKTRRANLQRLVAAGKDLHFYLFHDPKQGAQIRELKQWMIDEYREGDHKLIVRADDDLHVPWGLVYEDAPPASPDEGVPAPKLGHESEHAEIAEFGGFWSLRYFLSANAQIRPRSKLQRLRQNFGVLSLVNAEVEHEIESELGDSRYRELYGTPPIGAAPSLAKCHELIDATDRTDILIHFLGHHSDQELDLGGGERITYRQFAQLLETLARSVTDRNASAYGLMFLNACDSAVAHNLRREGMRSELCGVIGTESTVRAKFAGEFGYRFLKAMMVEGKTVAEAMSALHREPELWPESLLYGCYANPSYRIKPADAAAP